MSDTEQTVGRSKIEDTAGAAGGEPASPGADAPGDGARQPRNARAPKPAGGEAGAPSRGGDAGDEGASAVADGDAAEVEGELDELLRTQRDEYLALAQRTQADFENYRKRVARESAIAQGRGVASLAKELLPALDNLDRALEAAAQDDPLLDGVRLVRSELDAALARVGIESFSPVGETFDPALHEAMATTGQPVDGAESGTVVEVYLPGYRLGQSIIRPARVLVAS
jgi:molecular chaperone GrpE